MKTRSIAAGAVAILAVVAIVLTVVGYYGTQRRGPAPSTTASATSAPIPVSAGSVQAYYDQAIEWGVCADGTFDTFQGVNSSDASEYQCAFLKAPLDWENPDGDQITLALAIHRSGVESAPALFINPGGPGGAVVSALGIAEGHEALLVSHQLPVWSLRLFLEGRSLAHDPRRRQCALASLTSLTFEDHTLVGLAYWEPAGDLLRQARDMVPGTSAARAATGRPLHTDSDNSANSTEAAR